MIQTEWLEKNVFNNANKQDRAHTLLLYIKGPLADKNYSHKDRTASKIRRQLEFDIDMGLIKTIEQLDNRIIQLQNENQTQATLCPKSSGESV